MKKAIKKIYYSKELPKLVNGFNNSSGLCIFFASIKYNAWKEFSKYYQDSEDIIYLGQKGKWNNERLNLICLLIHSLELEN